MHGAQTGTLYSALGGMAAVISFTIYYDVVGVVAQEVNNGMQIAVCQQCDFDKLSG